MMSTTNKKEVTFSSFGGKQKNLDLKDCDLSGFQGKLNWKDVDATNCDIICSSFDNSKFEGCNFTGASIKSTALWNCTFIDCNFTNADLNNTMFPNCTFENCTFENTSFLTAKLSGCKFINCVFKSCKFIPSATDKIQLKRCKGIISFQLQYTNEVYYAIDFQTDVKVFGVNGFRTLERFEKRLKLDEHSPKYIKGLLSFLSTTFGER